MALLAVCLAFGAASRASARATSCAWASPPSRLADGPAGLILAWTIADSPDLFVPAPANVPGLARYRAWARARADVDPRALLRRQEKLYRRLGVRDADKIHRVLDGEIGRIESINCLEALLFTEHEARYPVEAGATEFLAFILRKDGRLKAYLLSHGDTNGVSPSGELVRGRLREDRAQGWILLANLHNHPFQFDNPSGDIGGTTVPSGDSSYGDVSVFQSGVSEYDMRGAWITNGFDTVRFDAADVAALGRLSAK